MEVTEVRIKLMDHNEDRLQAFCSITLDGEFVVRDLKVIEGLKGPFIAMPSRKLMIKCPRCSWKNEIRARHCNGCGTRVTADTNSQSRSRLFADIAHPINASCREKIQVAVIAALNSEREQSRLPDYICTYDDIEDVYAENPSN
ncbi:MAG: SpoVG family protein [Fuerstiella sp.]|nr:SpoVG family protein [Fuerstiella sp.]